MTLTEFLQKCKEINAKRTPGEWSFDGHYFSTNNTGVWLYKGFSLFQDENPEFIAFAANNFGKLVQALEASFKEIKVIRECALQEDAQNTAFKAFDSLCKIERLLLEDLKT